MAETRRPIRSFVLRQGRLTPGQQRALENAWPKWGLALPTSPLALDTLFQNNNPVTLEIGFGMGDSLAEQAQQHPDRNFVGVEVHQPGVGHLLMLVESMGLTNVRVFREDSIDVLDKAISDASLAAIQVFFPDPWHKKRHHKRRLVNATFIDRVCRKLIPGGCLHMATDWTPYAEEVSLLLADDSRFKAIPAPSRPETKFERRGIKLGHKVTDLSWVLNQ